MVSFDSHNGIDFQAEALRKENAVLATNISSLFRTAQLELERKNKEIAALRQATQP